MATGQDVLTRYAAMNEVTTLESLGPDADSSNVDEAVLLDKEPSAEVLTEALHTLGYWATWAPQRDVEGAATGWWHVHANADRSLLEGLAATAQHLVDRER